MILLTVRTDVLVDTALTRTDASIEIPTNSTVSCYSGLVGTSPVRIWLVAVRWRPFAHEEVVTALVL